MKSTNFKKILVSPLNWGLGHGTRCIPIINAIINKGWEPILASDGDTLRLLQREFPNLKSIELPSYNIHYPKKGNLTWHLLKQLPHSWKTRRAEQKLVQEVIKKENISGIISDNRFGVFSQEIPSIYITHQLTVLSGFTTFISTFFHHLIINKYDECWIPDNSTQKLSGKLSNPKGMKIPVKYIGALSRLKYESLPKKYDVCVLLSGIEPQRTLLENILLKELKYYKGEVCFVRGVISDEKYSSEYPFTFYNYLTTEHLNKALNQSELIIARSGYSTILDLATLGKKAFLIPTPRQTEQEYLAHNLLSKGIAPYCNQSEFTIESLAKIKEFDGFVPMNSDFPNNLFDVFL